MLLQLLLVGAGSAFATTVNSTDAITITSTGDNKYLGMWWSAGSPSNTIKFYDDSKLLLTMTTADIITLLGTAPTNGTDWSNRNNTTGTNAIAAADGTLYPKVWYFGNPRGYASTTPTAQSSITAREPFMYLHMFVGGGLTFNKIELSGGGFEFDNLTISTQTQTPATSLYELNTIYANHVVKFDANGANATGTMADQVNNAAANLTSNAFTRDGYTFKGWNTAANGSGTAYADAASFDFAADVTLYAQWEANTPPADNNEEETTGTLAETGANPYLGLLAGFLLVIAGAATALRLGRKN